MSEPTQIAGPVGILPLWAFVVIVIIFIAVAVISWVFRGRCPKCKRFFAFSKTGEKRGDRGFFSGNTWQEWLCCYCAHREWRKVERRGHGAPGGGG